MIYAGFWKRFAALIIDAIFVWVISVVCILPYFIPPLGLIIYVVYHVVFETSPLRGTPGKALMKIALVKNNGSLLTIKDSLIRFAVSFLSSALFCLGYFMSLFTLKRQTLHDMVADTVVIEEVFAEQNFWEIFITQAKIIFKSDNFNDSPSEGRTFTRPFNSQSLEELYNLHQKGILTDEEYKNKKEEYLKRL
jgi:uncharacterized RDD family membrane protein YckC